LFVSFDRCCDGVNSTYKIYVGRAKELTGPYLDRDDKPMLQGGGTQLVIGDETWHGPGHSAIFKSDDRWYEAHHAYYAGEPSVTYAPGQAYLRISELVWDAQGWPASGGP
jgi:arabinan endo-1,5-alpha-L-arabinosidase